MLAPVRGIHASTLPVYILSSNGNIDYASAHTDSRIAQFLVVNSDVTKRPTVVLNFGNGCNVVHFRESNLLIPLQSIRLSVNGVEEDLPRIWTRGSDCGMLTWSPPVAATYESQYQIDVLASWPAIPLAIAGRYLESLTVVAYTP